MIGVAALLATLLTFFRPLVKELVSPFERLKAHVARSMDNSAEVRKLKNEVAALAIVREENEALVQENLRLREALGYRERHGGRYVISSIINKAGAAVRRYGVLRVDKGSAAGIKDGAYVVTPEGLVGLVTSVSLSTSEITLITDPSIKISALVELPGGDAVYGILCGGSEENLYLKHLKESGGELTPHSRVLTSGLGGIYPKGLSIGTLTSRAGEVQPAVDFSTLEDVFIHCEE